MTLTNRPSTPSLVSAAIVIALWLATILVLGTLHVFRSPPSQPPLPTLVAFLGPPIVFAFAMKLSTSFRTQVLRIDPVWLIAVHGLRALGVGFLFMFAFGHLPGLFAHPAGWGDLAVALLAPFMATRLARDPRFLASKALWRFHALGMLDFAGAIAFGLLARYLSPTVDGLSATSALGEFPLLIIPCFAVPLWICLHLAAFAQIEKARNRSHQTGLTGPTEA